MFSIRFGIQISAYVYGKLVARTGRVAFAPQRRRAQRELRWALTTNANEMNRGRSTSWFIISPPPSASDRDGIADTIDMLYSSLSGQLQFAFARSSDHNCHLR